MFLDVAVLTLYYVCVSFFLLVITLKVSHFNSFILQPTKTLVKNVEEFILLTEPQGLVLGTSIGHVKGTKTPPSSCFW